VAKFTPELPAIHYASLQDRRIGYGCLLYSYARDTPAGLSIRYKDLCASQDWNGWPFRPLGLLAPTEHKIHGEVVSGHPQLAVDQAPLRGAC
jgi:hypothetical protein